jgi:hypothetical protein
MKALIKMLLFILILSFEFHAYSQIFETGIYSGINFSNAQGDVYYGKWLHKKGPVNAAYFNVKLLKNLSIQTEVDFTTITYEKQSLYNYSAIYYNYNNAYLNYESYSFNFYRFPLFLKLTTSDKYKLHIGVGTYWSICYDHSIYQPDHILYYSEITNNNVIRYAPYVPNATYDQNADVPKLDFGYIFSFGFSTAIESKYILSLNARYFSGRRKFISTDNGKNGVFELVMGIGFNGFSKRNSLFRNKSKIDSTQNKLSYKLIGGAGLSYNAGNKNHDYSSKPAFTTGIGISYKVTNGFHLKTEILFEQKGYSLKGNTSDTFVMSSPNSTQNDYKVNFRYFVIPAIISINFGNKIKYFINTGIYGAMLINANVKGTFIFETSSDYGYARIKSTINQDINGYFHRDDWGWLIGGGMGVPFISGSNFELELRYTKGFNNIYNQPYSLSGNKFQNQSLLILLGLQFPFKD